MASSNHVFCGDAAMNGFPSSHRITIWVGNISDFEASWETLLDEDISTVIPAHGKSTVIEHNGLICDQSRLFYTLFLRHRYTCAAGEGFFHYPPQQHIRLIGIHLMRRKETEAGNQNSC